MRTPEIIVNEQTGNRCLHIFYDKDACDWEERIIQACRIHKIERGALPILCFPEPIERKQNNDYLIT